MFVVQRLGSDELGVHLANDFQVSEQVRVELVALLWNEPESLNKQSYNIDMTLSSQAYSNGI